MAIPSATKHARVATPAHLRSRGLSLLTFAHYFVKAKGPSAGLLFLVKKKIFTAPTKQF